MTDTPNRPPGELPPLEGRTRHLEVLHEFALSQRNLDSLDEILWNVAKTAIAKLGFVDCVIYLVSDDGSTLVQKAAHGPKNPRQEEILNPITIKVGEGIVGTVAQTGEPFGSPAYLFFSASAFE